MESHIYHTHNPAGQVTQELAQTWDYENKTWLNTGKYEYNYDASEHRMNVYYYTYKENEWIENQKTICIYDNDGDLERVEYYKTFDNESLDAYCTYTYATRNATGLTEIVEEQSSVYPNPATTYVDLKITPALINKTAGLYDTTGKHIKDISIENNVTRIDLSSLPGGLYLIKIEDQTVKIVKR